MPADHFSVCESEAQGQKKIRRDWQNIAQFLVLYGASLFIECIVSCTLDNNELSWRFMEVYVS